VEKLKLKQMAEERLNKAEERMQKQNETVLMVMGNMIEFMKSINEKK
jgi:hypothetical protein